MTWVTTFVELEVADVVVVMAFAVDRGMVERLLYCL